ncbi:MAG: hypothetical protein ACU84Q_08145 [Gammaproteobacteria bacterium]
MFANSPGNSRADAAAPTFGEGIVVALALSALGAAGYICGPLLFGSLASSATVLIIVAAIYALYLVRRGDTATGKLISTVVIVSVAAALIGLSISLSLAIIAVPFGIWLIRSCFFRSRLIDSFTDLLLTLSSVAVMLFVAFHTHSPLLSLWTFFALQAFHVYLPVLSEKDDSHRALEQKFTRAFMNAENALRQYYATTK